MFDLLLLPISFLIGLAIYKYLEWRAAQKAVAPAPSAFERSLSADSQACTQIMNITSTNNSYDPMGDVLSELDMSEVSIILGKDLRADMEGYMQ